MGKGYSSTSCCSTLIWVERCNDSDQQPCAEAEASREAAVRLYSDVPAAGSGLSPDDGCGPLHGGTRRSILSPGGDSHFPWVEVCADTGLGLIREQKVQGAEAAVTKVTLEAY
ncbi:hypothetical protein QTO34_004795 [Cnephaeus nilssonii]|uniref:Uncharacterized protein n=1 Tax=Cnephaeus nilssonii TaxID=3371016 RepID=A0AA40HQU2_CNENI|nr:hypothetical protein QTO34_004795 [Eptesicus nilssonii]